jgi:NAD+ kinase
MGSTHVLLIADRDRPEVSAAVDVVARCAASHDCVVEERSPADDVRDIGGSTIAVVVGGDGTVIGQARRFLESGLDLPIVGVNCGRLGFLAAFDPDSLSTHAAMVFGDAPVIRSSMTMRVTGPGGSDEGIAINEAAIAAGPPYRMVELAMQFDAKPGPVLRGDGVIIATPTGSTAYNLSAGGPIVDRSINAMLVTPIAAYSLAFRPIVVDSTTVISVEVVGGNEGTSVVIDGQEVTGIGTSGTIQFTRHRVDARWICNPDLNDIDLLRTKMQWAAAPRYVR